MAGWPESRTFDKHVVNSQARRFPRDGCKGNQLGFFEIPKQVYFILNFCTLNTGTFNLEADVTNWLIDLDKPIFFYKPGKPHSLHDKIISNNMITYDKLIMEHNRQRSNPIYYLEIFLVFPTYLVTD